jgi:hypothetical protein
LVNYSQTISGQTIGPLGQRTYGGLTSALTSAQTNGTVKLASYADPSDVEPVRGATYWDDPLTGETYALPDDAEAYIIKPAGTIAAHNFNLPANPYDGMEFTFASTQIVTTLTITAPGTTVQATLAAATANGFATWRYRAADTTWYRVG